MSFKKWPAKDPDAIKDYKIDWAHADASGSPGLYASDMLASSIWILPTGITKQSDGFTPEGVTTIWIVGGTNGQSYSCVNRITTTGGRTDDRTIILPVKTQ